MGVSAKLGVLLLAAIVGPTLLLAANEGAQAADITSGSGFIVGEHGEILTSSHVVENCTQLKVQSSAGDSVDAIALGRDRQSDLAILRGELPISSVAVFRNGPIRAGDSVVALGYPLSGLLATSVNLTVGNVSALAGLGDDSRYLQISAPVQPGNSGGPLLDAGGRVIGIVSGKLNAARVAQFTGDIAQNVNFALKAEVARNFLDSRGVSYRTAPSDKQLQPADVGDLARPFTVRIECHHPVQQSDQNIADVGTTLTSTQRAVLYEEDLSYPPGRSYEGSTTWHTETVSSGPEGTPGLAVRADIAIPERHIEAVLVLRRNASNAMAASHTIEIVFKQPPKFPVATVPGVLMKDTKEARGIPLKGTPVQVSDLSFLMKLSAGEPDRQRNVQLLKTQTWFSILIVYKNGSRAVLAIEKGSGGRSSFAEAFAAWEK